MRPWAAKVQGEFEVSMELPPSNPDLNRSPSMLESDQSTAGSADVRRRKNWPLLLIFGFLGLLAGPLVGEIYFTICPVYQSQATISIVMESKRNSWALSHPPRLDSEIGYDFRHDQLIGEDTILTECLTKYGLKDLETLRDLSGVKQIEEIQKNLVVVQNREEPRKYDLEYFSTDPRDAQYVLAAIISTYEKHLEDEYGRPTPETIELFEKYAEIGKQLRMAEADEIHKLSLAEWEAWKQYDAEYHRSPRPYHVFFNQVERSQRGRQVRPVQAVMLPGLALIGAVVGLWFAYLGLLVVGATR